jgi:hypothetical protein
MRHLVSAIRRFILLQRIEMLRGDIAMGLERRDNARITIESMDAWLSDAQRRLRRLNSHLTVLERPGTLLAEALRHVE